MVYLHTILQRSEGEITRQINKALKADPSPGDWFNLVQKHIEVNLNINEDQRRNMGPSD